MEFSRQEYWSGYPCPSSGDLPDPGIEPGSLTLQANSLSSEPPGKPGSFGKADSKASPGCRPAELSVIQHCLLPSLPPCPAAGRHCCCLLTPQAPDTQKQRQGRTACPVRVVLEDAPNTASHLQFPHSTKSPRTWTLSRGTASWTFSITEQVFTSVKWDNNSCLSTGHGVVMEIQCFYMGGRLSLCPSVAFCVPKT